MIAAAQTYPAYQSLTVNEFASVLTEADKTTLSNQLEKLRADTGIEMVLVTLQQLHEYTSNGSMEDYATGLFNSWGIGNKDRNDGILVLVLINDRQMRIELGKGFERSWDGATQKVIDQSFLPDFRDGNYLKGIKTGLRAVIDQIARLFAADAPLPQANDGCSTNWIWLIFISFGFLAIYSKIADGLVRFRSCPSCGRRGGLRVSRDITLEATKDSTGMGQRRMYCTYCDHSEMSEYTISKRSSGSSRSFWGGNSGGAGVSGKW